ncbi:MAG: hypothetical protein ACREC6_12045 [Hyphomicrobiaceae bacterium]
MTMFARAPACILLSSLAALVVSGCGLSMFSGGMGGIIGGRSEPGKSEVKPITSEFLRERAIDDTGDAGGGEVAHDCPRVQVAARDNHLTIYERGRAGDPQGVMHRGEITRTARECTIQPGQITVKYGFSGRVLLGPSGKAGTVVLPVNVFVTDAKRARLNAEKMKVDVPIAVDKPIGYFSMVRTVKFAIPEGARPGEYEVLVGFDRSVPGAG